MKVLKLILFVFIGLILCVVALFIYFDSDYAEVRRLRGQVEKNLAVTLSKVPKLIQRKTHGWVEEGGDTALLALNKQDCLSVSQAMTAVEDTREKSEYFEMFKEHGIFPKSVKTWNFTNSHRDSTNYALATSSCVLYRRYHYE